MLEKVADWGWSLVLLALGGIGTVFSRWVSMIHKHEKQLVILEQTQQTRLQTDRTMVEGMASLGTKIEANRQEAMERMDALRRDLREDFKTLIEFARRQDDRG